MRAIKRFMGAASIELERHLQQGDFLIVIDNFSNRQRDARTFKRKTDMITKFISTYSANHFILFSDESEPVSAKVEKVAKFEFTHKVSTSNHCNGAASASSRSGGWGQLGWIHRLMSRRY